MSGRYKLYFGGFLLSSLALVGIALLGLFDALSVLSDPPAVYSETFFLLAMVQEAAKWVVAGVLVGLVAVVLLVATVVSVLRSKSLPRSSTVASLVEKLEYKYPILRKFDASDRFEPTTEDRADSLKQQYVDGDISEREFERKMDQLLDDDEQSSTTRSNRGTNINIED